ncbi:hypothetical protein TSUD_280160 [Trifolium subterraneum]|uniref:Endonuclease/exonuclease/phosphatase domain-containing protein n=1 Tax=Trifolium subterraneum TaxID=3900 RepID=A0A2Z6M0E8_TRISU|nr:hypothetical protein TSUD_280160 [Trifolium subterraneum]
MVKQDGGFHHKQHRERIDAGFQHHHQQLRDCTDVGFRRRYSRSPTLKIGNRQQLMDTRQIHDLKLAEKAPTGIRTFRQDRARNDSLGFEVCGMLEDVYVAKKLNKFGEPYGFVKFSKVKDVKKLLKALNVVYFGHFRVRARVARFDRNDAMEGRSSGTVKDSIGRDLRVQEIELIPRKTILPFEVATEKDEKIYIRNFRTKPDDVQWAHNGLVATIINGEAVPVVQNRITDAGFHDLILIPMGADKMRWGKEVLPYRRGAWIRLYGIPLHAWNVHFFKLCVLDCGRVEKVLVDGTLTEIKIVEEWGYALGEDTCLFEEESGSEASQNDNEAEHRCHVDILVEKLVDGLEEEDDIELQLKHVEHSTEKQDVNHSVKVSTGGCGDRDSRTDNPPLVPEAQVSSSINEPYVGNKTTIGVGRPEGPIMKQSRRVIFTAGKRLKKGGRAGVRQQKEGGGKEISWSGDLSHRASSDESSSSISVNNDWKHWVVMQGDERAAEDDVQGFGERFKGDSENKFSVFSRTGKGKRVSSGQGLGGLEKRKDVRKLVGDQNPLFLCLQETKLHSCDVFLGSALWVASMFCGVMVWFIKSGEEFYVANVYALCDARAKQRLWDSLSVRIQSLGRQRVCVCGNFNAVRSVEERRSLRGVHSSWDFLPFNRFIDDNTLVNLPLSGRKLTWFRGDGLSMSRLDRFLLSEDWCLTWPNCKQEARMREKLKKIKAALKDWNMTHTQNLPSRIDCLKAQQSLLDQKGEDEVLTEAELMELHGVTADIHTLSRLHASVWWQQSRRLSRILLLTSRLRPGINNLLFKTLNPVESSSLIKPFSREERTSVATSCTTLGAHVPEFQLASEQTPYLIGGKDTFHLPGPFSWGRSEASGLLGICVVSFKESIIWVEESLPVFWWSSDSDQVCSNLFSCLCSFLLQSSLRSMEVWGLGKWCWRMLVDREGLWYRVLEARYGVERGRLRDGGRRGFSWWREIVRIRDSGGGTSGAQFGECISEKVGNGSGTLFWTDPWVDEIPLCERFGRLFDLAETQSYTVAEMALLGWGASGEAWVWRRQLRGWEEFLLGECQTLLLNISLQVTHKSKPGYSWHLIIGGSFFACLDAERLNQLNTCSFPVVLLVLSGPLSILGLDLHWWIHILFRTILRSSLFQQVGPGCVALLCNSYGLLACGLCGTSGTLDVSKA